MNMALVPWQNVNTSYCNDAINYNFTTHKCLSRVQMNIHNIKMKGRNDKTFETQ